MTDEKRREDKPTAIYNNRLNYHNLVHDKMSWS